MAKYIIQKSNIQPNGWVLTDTVHGIVVTFEQGKFNETQKVTVLEDVPNPSPTDLAHIMGELSDWARQHHPDKLF
ncbi:hypothetical protein [Prevotella falsenii]|uniref:hypothetical protein n=1 Tax=Prevotella falsenii TaxID=515414 RepID=UPI000468B720|nr:hypothetical protein [Prevotella falsenii]